MDNKGEGGDDDDDDDILCDGINFECFLSEFVIFPQDLHVRFVLCPGLCVPHSFKMQFC